MNSTAYGVVQRETASARDLEREVLERVTMRLRSADPGTVAGLALLHEALRVNRNIWLTFAADLASPGNPFPDSLKAAIISIAGYVERNTLAASEDRRVLESLVEINEIVAAGLASHRDPAASGTDGKIPCPD